MKIAITADSTCDISKNICKENDIHIIPITVIMDDKEFKDGETISTDEIYSFVSKNNKLPSTSAIPDIEYKEIFEEIKKDYDAIIHFSLSSGISSTCNNAIRASKELNNVYVIDTKSLSSGSGLLILSCVDKIKEGKDVETIVKELNEEVSKVQASFLISKLNYLAKGGRCPGILALGANLIGLKIKISLVDGKMQKTKQYLGKLENAFVKYLNDLIAEKKPDLNRVFITSSSNMDSLKDLVEPKLKELGFKEIIRENAGATIASHCGPGTIGILYMEK